METIKDPIKPQLILFDYGHTLLSEPGWDPMKGLRALLEYADRRCSEEEIQHIYAVGSEYYDTVIMPVKEQGGDIPWKTAARLVLGSCGVGLTISPDEAEDIYWNAETCGAVMPGADEMLDAIASLGIRYGVVSNLTMSGEALERRIRRLIPHAVPELVVTSSDIGVRKPNPMIFDYALSRCGASAEHMFIVDISQLLRSWSNIGMGISSIVIFLTILILNLTFHHIRQIQARYYHQIFQIIPITQIKRFTVCKKNIITANFK